MGKAQRYGAGDTRPKGQMKKEPRFGGHTLPPVVQFLHIGCRLWRVWGIGVAFSLGGGWQIDSAWEWMAMNIEWKLYLGPLIVIGRIPYRVKPCPHKLNATVDGRTAKEDRT
jgi:hypothetical protein